MIWLLCKIISAAMLCLGIVLCGLLFFRIELHSYVYFLDFMPDFILIALCIPALIFFQKARFLILASTILLVSLASPFQVNFNSLTSETEQFDQQKLLLASFNIAQRVSSTEIYNWFEVDNLDILFVQEGRYGMFNDAANHGLFGECVKRLCILSKYKLTQLDSLERKPLGGWGHFASFHEIIVDNTPILLVNVHFASISNFGYRFNTLGGFESKVSLFKETKAIEFGLVRSLIDTWGENNAIVIGGDFNITDRNPQYAKFWDGFSNKFGESGNGYGTTRKNRFLSPRIDHILLGDDLLSVKTFIGKDMGSDHLPVVGVAKFKREYQ